MSIGSFAAFWVVSILFVITPGVDWAYAISTGLRHRSPLPAVAGMLSGHLAATAVVAAGAGALVTRVPAVLVVLTVAGALYLVWLGVGMVRQPAAVQVDGEAAGEPSRGRQFGKGLGVSVLNPKVFLLFLALLPQFTDPQGSWSAAVQMFALGCVHVLSCAVVYLAVAYSAKRILRARPRAAQVVTRISGAAMVVIGALLLIRQVWP